LNATERVQTFINGMDEYINLKNICLSSSFNEEYKIPENFMLEDLNRLTRDDCFNYSYVLYQYADYINMEKGRQLSVLNWCSVSLSEIISKSMDEYSFAEFTKHETKVSKILQDNSVGSKINEWKNIAESRVALLITKEQLIRKRADCLLEKGKRI